MHELLTAAQMRAVEAAAIASGAVTGLELMERAGRGVVEAVFEEWPELARGSFRTVVLCGPGNNGGDGFVVARLLKDWGWDVEVFFYGDPAKLPPDARANYERWCGMGEVLDVSKFKATSTTYDLGVDAIFGTGLSRMIPNVLEQALENLRMTAEKIVAVDMPSGLCSDSGKLLCKAPLSPELTVTFSFRKLGQYLADGWKGWSTLKVCEIGLDRLKAMKALGVHVDPNVEKQWRPADWSKVVRTTDRILGGDTPPENCRWIGKNDESHKFSHGHALILAGPHGQGGAARLAARGALRIGAGVVTVACPPDSVPEHAARLDAVMVRPVVNGASLTEILADSRINALCLGPGMGTSARAVGLVAAALGGVEAEPDPTRRFVVLDADALTILSQSPDLFARLHDRCVLTPHAGEFARLFPDLAEKLTAPATKGPAYSKVDATREAAARAGCVVLFKGADTVISHPDGRCSINSAHYDRAAPWLATAGSGDVLAGFIAGLLARGFESMAAAETAAWLHVECSRSFGPGLIAEDLSEELPKVFRSLGL